jgi:type III secretion protein N (ATPase)
MLIAHLYGARAGDTVRVHAAAGASIVARVTAVENRRVVLAPAGDVDGVAAGDRVEADPSVAQAILGCVLLGRAIGGDGAVLDGGVPPWGRRHELMPAIVAPGERRPVRRPFWTGVRAIDGMLTFGRGARVGVFGQAGAGKSQLLATIAAGSRADATVVALIGERGREAEHRLRGMDARTTLVCATSDRSAAERLRAAEFAFAQADALRSRGLHVLLIVDSLARIAAAARDLAIADGEPLGRGGLPPSVVARQAQLLERAGAVGTGSVTLLATVLAEGPLEHDPIAGAALAALDGHIVLSARLAQQGWFPAIDIGASASRTFGDVASSVHRRAAARVRAALAALEASREARSLGLDPAAGDPFLARAVAGEARIGAFLQQDAVPAPPAETLMRLIGLADTLDNGPVR